MKAAAERSITVKLFTELQALKRLYGIVRAYERGESLEGLAY
jgi:hypothetical protein